VRTIASLKAVGCAKHFQYQAQTHQSGGRIFQDETCTMIDRNGIPMPALAAHAAAVYFLEDAQAKGVDELKVGGAKITICHFLAGKETTDVVWTRTPTAFKNLAALKWEGKKAFDMMGNPVALSGETVLAASPIYLVK
ncbi:MAG: hypothetical protein JNM63_09125, partial [Spirochaetia bacterium]|nr:hypothetical protein [Spirochaetia bacterium]